MHKYSREAYVNQVEGIDFGDKSSPLNYKPYFIYVENDSEGYVTFYDEKGEIYAQKSSDWRKDRLPEGYNSPLKKLSGNCVEGMI